MTETNTTQDAPSDAQNAATARPSGQQRDAQNGAGGRAGRTTTDVVVHGAGGGSHDAQGRTTGDGVAQDAGAGATDAPEPQGAGEGQQDDTGADSGDSRPEREAARYRRQLRQAEAERDTLRDQLTSTRRAMIESLPLTHRPEAGPEQRLSDPADLFDYGDVDLDALFPEGTLDRDALASKISKLYDDRPRLFERANSGPVVKAEGKVPNAKIDEPMNWQRAFKRAANLPE